MPCYSLDMKYVWEGGLMEVLLQVGDRLVEFYGFLYLIYIAGDVDPVVGGTLRVIHYTVRNNNP